MPYLKLKNSKVFYLHKNHNKQDLVVFIHGLGTNHQVFKQQFDLIKDRQAIFIDLLSFSGSRTDIKIGFEQQLKLVKNNQKLISKGRHVTNLTNHFEFNNILLVILK